MSNIPIVTVLPGVGYRQKPIVTISDIDKASFDKLMESICLVVRELEKGGDEKHMGIIGLISDGTIESRIIQKTKPSTEQTQQDMVGNKAADIETEQDKPEDVKPQPEPEEKVIV